MSRVFTLKMLECGGGTKHAWNKTTKVLVSTSRTKSAWCKVFARRVLLQAGGRLGSVPACRMFTS